jgi:acetylornithine deacetylase/succinyl-diaminopimelate desuccinylase-like protein
VLLGVVLFASCATIPEPPPHDTSSLASTQMLASVDWSKAGDEAFDDLRGYLMVPTINPPGDEKPGAEFLAQLLAKDGIEAELDEIAPNRANLYARIKGSGAEGPLCLVSHIDVVTAEPARWPKGKGPFEGAIDVDPRTNEKTLWGRGALDMKGLGLLEVEVMRWLARLKVPLKRDVILIAVTDEEVGSDGMEQVVEKRWNDFKCSHSINEGGLGLRDALVDGQALFGISVAEKGFVWVRVKASGPPGHGSTPIPRAPQRLLEAMKRLDERKPKARVHASLYELLAAAGREVGGFTGFVMQRPFLVDSIVVDKLLAEPASRALVIDTMNLTGFAGANSPNVVPSEVFAQYDIRILPGTKPEDVVAEMKKLVEGIEGISIEVIDQKSAAESSWDDPLYRALAHHATAVHAEDGVQRAVAGPLLSPGFTDSIYLREKGVRAYGFVPVLIDREEAATMHGDAERISHPNVRRALKALLASVVDVSAQ